MMWACWAADTSLTFPVHGRHQPSGNLQAHVLLHVPKPAQRHYDRGWVRRPAGLLLLRLRSDQQSSRGAVVVRGREAFSLCDDVALAVRAARLPFVSQISFTHEFGDGGSCNHLAHIAELVEDDRTEWVGDELHSATGSDDVEEGRGAVFSFVRGICPPCCCDRALEAGVLGEWHRSAPKRQSSG
jgi:hypothetical protein